MKIVIISPTINISVGGVERFVGQLARAYQEVGHDVVILGAEMLGTTTKILVRCLNWCGLGQVLAAYLLGRLTQKYNPDFIVTNGIMGWGVTGDNIINIQHGSFVQAAERIDKGKNWFKFLVRKYVWGYCERIAAQHSAVCVVHSEDTRSLFQDYHGITSERLVKIYQAVDTEFFNHQPAVTKKPQSIFVGRYEYAKGGDVLDLISIYLHEQGRELFIAENLNDEQLVRAYNESDVLFFPTRQEGGPYVVLEAMACGIPFFMSPVGLGKEFLKDDFLAAFIVKENRSNSYINAYEQYGSKTEKEKQEIGARLRSYVVKHHSFEVFAKSHQELLAKVCFDTKQ